MLTTNPFPIDKQIGTLLAFIILFEKKIEALRIKLAGNEEFHSRLAFQLLDKRRKCELSAEDLCDGISGHSSGKSIAQMQALCRKYTANGGFSYDEFLKFLTPKTSKPLAQRLLIRTYRSGTQLPPYVIHLLFQTLSTATTMLTITQNIRHQIQQNTQLTHIEIIQLFKKCCTSKQNLFYFINASTNGQGDYDFTLDEMSYLGFHVRGGSCDLEDLDDCQIKEILYPLDMNYCQKAIYYGNMMTTGQGLGGKIGGNNDVKNRTDYFKTKAALEKVAMQEEERKNRTMVNFLKTNYRQTSKGGFYNAHNKQRQQSRQLFTQSLQQNIQPHLPAATTSKPSFPSTSIQKQVRFTLNPNDSSSVSSHLNFNNLYIQKFTRGATNDLEFSRSNHTVMREWDGYMSGGKYEGERKREVFNDSLKRKGEFESGDEVSSDSAFLQY